MSLVFVCVSVCLCVCAAGRIRSDECNAHEFERGGVQGLSCFSGVPTLVLIRSQQRSAFYIHAPHTDRFTRHYALLDYTTCAYVILFDYSYVVLLQGTPRGKV